MPGSAARSRHPRLLLGASLPPGVPPPKKGDLYMQVEGLQWQSTTTPPASCTLLISWWGQAMYNSLLVPLHGSSPISPVTALFALHSSPKQLERYLQDMGFLEVTLLHGSMFPDLKNITDKILGKLTVNLLTLNEEHAIQGSYPVFADGQRLIASLTLTIRISYLSSSVEKTEHSVKQRTIVQRPRIVSSFERNEELALADLTLPLFPTTPAGPLRKTAAGGWNSTDNPLAKFPLKGRGGVPPSSGKRENLLPRRSKHPSSSSVHGSKETKVRKGLGQLPSKHKASLQSSKLWSSRSLAGDGNEISTSCDREHLELLKGECSPERGELPDSEGSKLPSARLTQGSKNPKIRRGLGQLLDERKHSSSEAEAFSMCTLGSLVVDSYHVSSSKRLTPSDAEKEVPLTTNPSSFPVDKEDEDLTIFLNDGPHLLTPTMIGPEDFQSLSDIGDFAEIQGFSKKDNVRMLRSPPRHGRMNTGGLSDMLEPSDPANPHSPTNTTAKLECFQGSENKVKLPTVYRTLDRSTSRKNSFPVDVTTMETDAKVSHKAPSESASLRGPSTNLGWDSARDTDGQDLKVQIMKQVEGSSQNKGMLPTGECTFGRGCTIVAEEPIDTRSSENLGVGKGFDPGGDRACHEKFQDFKAEREQQLVRPILKKYTMSTRKSMVERDMTIAHSFKDPRAIEGFDRGGDLACDDNFRLPRVHPEQHLKQHTKNTIPTGELILERDEVMVRGKFCRPGSAQHTVMNNIDQLIQRAEAFRDALKSSELFNISSNTTTEVPTGESSALSTSRISALSSREDSVAKLIDNILTADKNDGVEKVAPQVPNEVAEDLEGGVKASDVAAAALLQALFVSDRKEELAEPTADCNVQNIARTGENFDEITQNSTLKEVKGGKPCERKAYELESFFYGGISDFKVIERNDIPTSSQGISQMEPSGEVLCLRVRIGKLVLCGPTVRDLADIEPAIASRTLNSHPSCTCLLTISFPAIVQPFPEQRISISPIKFQSREALFDHQSQLSWKLPSGQTLEHWRCQELRVKISLTWHRFEALECNGSILLDKVVGSMPSAYRTSLALTLFYEPHRSSSSSPFRRKLKICEKHKLERSKPPGSSCSRPGMRSGRSGPKRNSVFEREPVARVDIVLQLTRDNTSLNKLETTKKMKRSPPRLLQFSSSVVTKLDLWLHVIVHDVDNCLGKARKCIKKQGMLLVVKSGPRSACRVPFPILGSDRCQDGKGSSNAVLQAPLELDKAVIFVEVWRSWEVVKDGLGALVGLVKVPLRVANIPATPEDYTQIRDKGGEVAATGSYPVQDPLKCIVSGTVKVLVTLGLEYQMRRLLRANRAAMIIQWYVREFLKSSRGDARGIEITRYYSKGKRDQKGQMWR